MNRFCIICGKQFACNDKPRKGGRGTAKRKVGCLTCSMKCSLKYNHFNGYRRKCLKQKLIY